MATSPHYQRLPSVEVDEANNAGASHEQEAVQVPSAPVVEVVDSVPLHSANESPEDASPPAYGATVGEASSSRAAPTVTSGAPPSYTTSSSIPSRAEDAKLPTYEDYEKLHENDEEFDTNLPEPYIMPADYSTAREGVPAVTVVEGRSCSSYSVDFAFETRNGKIVYVLLA